MAVWSGQLEFRLKWKDQRPVLWGRMQYFPSKHLRSGGRALSLTFLAPTLPSSIGLVLTVGWMSEKILEMLARGTWVWTLIINRVTPSSSLEASFFYFFLNHCFFLGHMDHFLKLASCLNFPSRCLNLSRCHVGFSSQCEVWHWFFHHFKVWRPGPGRPYVVTFSLSPVHASSLPNCPLE